MKTIYKNLNLEIMVATVVFIAFVILIISFAVYIHEKDKKEIKERERVFNEMLKKRIEIQFSTHSKTISHRASKASTVSSDNKDVDLESLLIMYGITMNGNSSDSSSSDYDSCDSSSDD